MDLSPETLSLGILWFVAFLLSTTLHEAAHALAALRLGDPTAYHGGQVSLSPLPHIRREPFGMVVLPLLSYLYFQWPLGWASAPYDPLWADRYPKRAGLMALAGPTSNFGLMVLAGVCLRIGIWRGDFFPPARLRLDHLVDTLGGGALEGVAAFLSILFSLNLILFLFNLFPVPPLDGSGVLQLFLSEDAGRRWQEIQRQPMLAWGGILLAWWAINPVIDRAFLVAMAVLHPSVQYG